jgi:DtxR family transcriptional regulator, Mn-dependent transcriptional regulator
VDRPRPALRCLPAILELEEQGVVPLRVRLAEHFDASLSTIAANVQRLERDGYLVVRADRVIALTEDGLECATMLLRRYRLAEHFLSTIVGVASEDLGREAERLASVISDEVDDALTELLKDPHVCPHGNAIPAAD